MKSLYFKRTLVSLACIGLLAGCVEDEDSEDTSTSTYVVYSMTAVTEDYQTFQQRDLDYDDVDVDDDDSTYIYKDREYDDSSDVVFNSANSSDTDTEDLVVSEATDINDTYTVFYLDDVTVKVESVNYSGDYVLVQEKSSGDLYTVINGADEPIDTSNIDDDMYWMSNYTSSNIADEDRIYLNDSDSEILYIYEFDGDYFTYIDTFSYSGNDFWIDENGDILRKSSSNSKYFYYYDQGDYSDPMEKEASYSFLPFLYDGDFYAGRASNSNIYEIITQSSTFSFSYDSTWTNDDDYEAATDSARVGNYEMSSDCALYEFNDDNPYAISIDLVDDVDDLDLDDGQLAVAGQDALFCVYSDDGDAAVLKYDTETEEVTTYTATDGDLSDAADYFSVISDTEVMFAEADSGTFDEYYIDLDDETTETIEVTESSIVFLQRL